GTLWEFFELSGDLILKKDMQKDTVVDFIYTVMLDDSNSNVVVRIEGIEDTILVLKDGSQVSLGVGGYLDVGLYDTMKDMFVNFIGALVFSTIGYFYVKNRGKGRIARQFIPVKQEASEANMNVIFIGMPTSGKSTVGVLVAKALGYGFIDADLVIQERKGKRLSEIISEVGPDAFNQIEEEINSSIVADRSVIAPGGSVIYGPKAMEHYKSIGKIVYLRLSYEGVAARLKNARARGVSMKDGYTLKDLYEERAPLYERYADLTVDCDQKTLDEVVEETLHRLAEVTEE
ncbi:MAG: shikimate kinase, partial [Christensenellaceae bacterium]